MVGYNYEAGMSNNALDAYDCGIKPLSQISAHDLKLAGWTRTKKLAIFLAKNKFWSPCEWHHSGGTWYNEVDFYNPKNLVNNWQRLNTAEKQQHIKNCSKKEPTEKPVRVEGYYTIWGGSRRRPRRIGEQNFTGEMVGNWIFLDDGGKKKATGNHITWHVVQEGGKNE